MKIVITGDFLRPGQEGNIAFFWAAISRNVRAHFEVEPELVTGRPLTWDQWRHARLESPNLYRQAWEGADLIIGFELPPALRVRAAQPWINIRRHPLRFDARQVPFSFTTSFTTSFMGTAEMEAAPLQLQIPRLTPIQGVAAADDIAIMLQVSSDAALLEGTELLKPGQLWLEFSDVVRHNRVWLVPHPQEPHNEWRQMLACSLAPLVAVWPGTAYEAMATMKRMVTVSSSTGFEAPYFGCTPIFLRPPAPPSAPYDLRDAKLWAELARKFSSK